MRLLSRGEAACSATACANALARVYPLESREPHQRDLACMCVHARDVKHADYPARCYFLRRFSRHVCAMDIPRAETSSARTIRSAPVASSRSSRQRPETLPCSVRRIRNCCCRLPTLSAQRDDFREELFRHGEKYIVSRITFRRRV